MNAPTTTTPPRRSVSESRSLAGIWLLLGCSAIVLISVRFRPEVAPDNAQPSSYGDETRIATAPQPPNPSEPENISGAADNDTQVEELVQLMLKSGALKEIDIANREAQINPLFWARCQLDDRRGLVKTLALYFKHHGASSVTLLSSRTGRKLGSYDAWSGIQLPEEE